VEKKDRLTGAKISVFFLLVALLTAGLLSCSEKVTDDFVYDTAKSFEFRDVQYGSEVRQKMNVFLPASRSHDSTNVIVLIHGGGWVSGDKNDFDTFGNAFRIQGIAAVTMNYRYADAAKGRDYSDLLDDVGSALKCLADSSRRYTVKAENICLLGHSAGGHLALLYAYSRNSDRKVGKVVSLAGPTDLDDPLFLSISGITDLVNNLTGFDIDKRKAASPVNHLSPVTTYLYHGKTDAIVPWQQSDKLFSRVGSMNSKNRLTLIENCGHGFGFSEFTMILEESVELINKTGN